MKGRPNYVPQFGLFFIKIQQIIEPSKRQRYLIRRIDKLKLLKLLLI